MRIGIPREILPAEKRVATIPKTVAKYIQNDVIVKNCLVTYRGQILNH